MCSLSVCVSIHTCKALREAQDLSVNTSLSTLLAHMKKEHFDQNCFPHTCQVILEGKYIAGVASESPSWAKLSTLYPVLAKRCYGGINQLVSWIILKNGKDGIQVFEYKVIPTSNWIRCTEKL